MRLAYFQQFFVYCGNPCYYNQLKHLSSLWPACIYIIIWWKGKLLGSCTIHRAWWTEFNKESLLQIIGEVWAFYHHFSHYQTLDEDILYLLSWWASVGKGPKGCKDPLSRVWRFSLSVNNKMFVKFPKSYGDWLFKFSNTDEILGFSTVTCAMQASPSLIWSATLSHQWQSHQAISLTTVIVRSSSVDFSCSGHIHIVWNI